MPRPRHHRSGYSVEKEIKHLESKIAYWRGEIAACVRCTLSGNCSLPKGETHSGQINTYLQNIASLEGQIRRLKGEE